MKISKNDFKQKFEVFKSYKDKMPGVKTGLFLLDELNKEKIVLFKDSKTEFESVDYYDISNDAIYSYCNQSLNYELHKIYTDFLNNKIVLYNKLYWIFSGIFENIVIKNDYKYSKDFSVHDVLNKFIYGLRKNSTNDVTKYFVAPVLNEYYLQYLDISGERFYLVMRQFILELWKANVLTYELSEDSIAFNPAYHDDLCKLVYFSFDFILLGKNKYFMNFDLELYSPKNHLEQLYSKYLVSDEIQKLAIDDLLVSFVVSCSVETIAADKNTNNIFVENLIHGSNNKNTK